MPGMGGPHQSRNFIHNCDAWKNIAEGSFKNNQAVLRLAPMTGAVENAGYADEKSFYFDMISRCAHEGIKVTIGDGTPDTKLLYGIEAVRASGIKASVFVKPYPDEKILERFEWAHDIAELGGIDIDSYSIITMRNLVHLEKKNSDNLLKIKDVLSKKGIPFAIKGIFLEEDIELVQKVKPDVVYVSNHGGRVDTREGSTAEFLASHYKTLLSNAGELWVDGGIRKLSDFNKAASYGASSVLVGRPFITALCSGKPFTEILR
ncbi:MAG: alpha-hydroxy-acid oxidizing protein [Treponema sp.]|nr:alpha-hydroxy-acid oxidizing protein [Treponema sp.]